VNAAAPALTEEQLLAMTKEQLAQALLLALQAQHATTQNMVSLTELLKLADAGIKERDDKLASQEAELIMLRSRP
jgi:hypothetical protein